MEWSEIEIHSTNDAIEPITNLLMEKGAAGTAIENTNNFSRVNQFGEIYAFDQLNSKEEESVVIKAYFPQTKDFLAKKEQLEADLRDLSKYGIFLGNFKFFINPVDEENWANAWKKYYHPVKVTEKIVVAPIWEEYVPNKGEIVIALDPGMAFGTGTHATTQLCLRALNVYLKPGMNVIDVGSGSGILSIAAAKLGAEEVLAIDLDEIAVKSASENIAYNHVERSIIVQQNDLLKGIQRKADIVIANILAEVILSFLHDVYDQLKPNGLFIASGIIKSKSQQVIEALNAAGFILVKTEEQEDWVAIICKRGEH